MDGSLEVEALCKSYHGRQVLAPLSFTLPRGECLSVVGTNGSGKSTLLRMVAQVQKPDSGRVLYDGHDVRGDPRFVRRCLGYVPQEDAVSEELTVKEQLDLWRAACGLRGPVPDDVTALLGLEQLFRSRIGDLSGGQRRRVSIAMALSTQPAVLVMDEATSGLDEAYRDALLGFVYAFLRTGGSVLWCTHRGEELGTLGGRCLRLEEGRAIWT